MAIVKITRLLRVARLDVKVIILAYHQYGKFFISNRLDAFQKGYPQKLPDEYFVIFKNKAEWDQPSSSIFHQTRLKLLAGLWWARGLKGPVVASKLPATIGP